MNTSTTSDDPSASITHVLHEITIPIQTESFCNNYINSDLMGTPAHEQWPMFLCIGDGKPDRVHMVIIEKFLILCILILRAPALEILVGLLLFKSQENKGL